MPTISYLTPTAPNSLSRATFENPNSGLRIIRRAHPCTEDNPADVMTKSSISVATFEKHNQTNMKFWCDLFCGFGIFNPLTGGGVDGREPLCIRPLSIKVVLYKAVKY